MVSFDDNAHNYNTNDIRNYLHNQIKQSIHLTHKLKLINEANEIQSAGKKKKKIQKGLAASLIPGQHSSLSFADDIDMYDVALME